MPDSAPHAINELYRREFSNNLEHEIQQEISQLSNRVKVESFTGKQKVYNSLEANEWRRRNGRLQLSAPTEAEFHNRVMTKIEFYDQRVFDRSDDEFLGDLSLPDSEVIQGMRMKYGELLDIEICKQARATVYGGQEPFTTAITMPTEQQVPVGYINESTAAGAAIDLTPHKLLKACSIFEKNNIDPLREEIILVMDPTAKLALMEYVEDSPNDVWATMISGWLEGKDSKLFNMTPVISNNIETASNVAYCFAYSAKRGIYMAPGALDIKMDILPTQQHALQISAYATLGFMRRFEKGVVQILCDRA
jgi:hypothetical protein